MAPENKRKGGRFRQGEVGNPNGRPKGSKNRPSTLPMSTALAAVELSQQGHSEARIAKMLDAKPEAVKEALGQSRKLLELFSPQFAEHWLRASEVAAEDGDHKPAMAALQSVKAVEPIAQAYDVGGASAKAVAGVQVQFVGFGFAGLPQGQPAAEPVTVDVTARSGT